MNTVLRFLMRLFPFLWFFMGLVISYIGKYDLAAYDMAAGAFFMILPMYYAFLDSKGDW